MNATLNLPRVKLTGPELIWLREVYELFKSGAEANVRALRVRLRELLPVDFEPENIDGRVLIHGRILTLYGIWHVDPSTTLLNEADAVIQAIRNLIFEDAERESITSEEVANVTELPQPRVEMLIKQIRFLGFFWSDVERASDDGYSEVKVKDSRILKEYLQYEGIEQLIERINQKDEYAKGEEVRDDLHLLRLRKISGAAGESQHKRINLAEALKDEGLSQAEINNEAEYMEGEGWIKATSDEGMDFFITHAGTMYRTKIDN